MKEEDEYVQYMIEPEEEEIDTSIKTESEFNLNIKPMCMMLIPLMVVFLALRIYNLIHHIDLTGDYTSIHTLRNAYYIIANYALLHFVFQFYHHITVSPGQILEWKEIERCALFALICCVIKVLIVIVFVIPHYRHMAHLLYLVGDVAGWSALAVFFFRFFQERNEEVKSTEMFME